MAVRVTAPPSGVAAPATAAAPPPESCAASEGCDLRAGDSQSSTTRGWALLQVARSVQRSGTASAQHGDGAAAEPPPEPLHGEAPEPSAAEQEAAPAELQHAVGTTSGSAAPEARVSFLESGSGPTQMLKSFRNKCFSKINFPAHPYRWKECLGSKEQRFSVAVFMSRAFVSDAEGKCAADIAYVHGNGYTERKLVARDCDSAARWAVHYKVSDWMQLESPLNRCMDTTDGYSRPQTCQSQSLPVDQFFVAGQGIKAKLNCGGWLHTHGSYGMDRLGPDSSSWAETMELFPDSRSRKHFKVKLLTGRGAGKWLHVHRDDTNHFIGPADEYWAAAFRMEWATSYEEDGMGGLPPSGANRPIKLYIDQDTRQHGWGSVGRKKVSGSAWRLSTQSGREGDFQEKSCSLECL